MNIFYIIHGSLCVALILLVLLQQGKGAGVGFSMGGAGQAMFGGSGGRDFFIKLTAGLAIAFVISCLTMAKMASRPVEEYKGALAGASAPAPAAAPIAPVGAAPMAQPAKPAGK